MTTVPGEGGDTSDRMIQREDRWKLGIDMYKIYNRNNIADPTAASRKLAGAGKNTQEGPGKGTRGLESDLSLSSSIWGVARTV